MNEVLSRLYSLLPATMNLTNRNAYILIKKISKCAKIQKTENSEKLKIIKQYMFEAIVILLIFVKCSSLVINPFGCFEIIILYFTFILDNFYPIFSSPVHLTLQLYSIRG